MESTANRRLLALENHIVSNETFNIGQVPPKSDDDVVIVGMARTALTKAKRGAQKDTPCEAMLTPCLQAVLK
jgi:acetyl-CoA acyltransferase 1